MRYQVSPLYLQEWIESLIYCRNYKKPQFLLFLENRAVM